MCKCSKNLACQHIVLCLSVGKPQGQGRERLRGCRDVGGEGLKRSLQHLVADRWTRSGRIKAKFYQSSNLGDAEGRLLPLVIRQ